MLVKEQDWLFCFDGVLYLCQYFLFVGFDQLEIVQIEVVFFDGFQDGGVGVVVGFDVIDIVVQLIFEFGDIGIGFQFGIIGCFGYGKVDQCIFQIGVYYFDIVCIDQWFLDWILQGYLVVKKYICIVFFQ